MASPSPAQFIHLGTAIGVLRRDDQVLFVEQFRSSISQRMLEFPGGEIKRDEDPEQALRRELYEEVGAEVRACRLIARLTTSVGLTDEIVHCYFVTDYRLVGRTESGITPHWDSINRIAELAKRGSIVDGKSLALAGLISAHPGLVT